MTTLTRFVLGHKKLVVVFWLIVTVVAFGAIGPAADALSEEFNLPGREAFETNVEVAQIYGNGGDVAPIVPVVTLPEGTTVDSPGIVEELAAAFARVQAALPNARVASYASTGDRAFVSDDGRTTYGLAFIPLVAGLDLGQEEARLAQEALDGVTVGGSPVEVTGLEALRGASEGGEGGDSDSGVLLEVLIAGAGALIILGFVFASFMALVPLLMAIVAIPTTFLLVWPLAGLTDVSIIVQFLIAFIGLGIAIDYALLVVMRWREERQRTGATNEAAVQRAMEHAGSVVVFSGTTVAIALLAMIALPVPVLRSIGIAGLLIPLVSVAVAVTLLPVLLATIGPRLDWPRIRREDTASRAWSAWARLVVRNRWAAAAISGGVLVALAIAAFSMQLGNPRAESLAQSGPARAFRSIILPLKAVLLNLLSVAAIWGVMVLVWQKGFGSEAIWGIEATGSINEWLPVMIFAFLFGVSMDYQVFIISRMRETYDRTGSTNTAIVEGIGRTGRLVTSAALILGLAFLALSAQPGTELKIFATALAAGILIDATLVRAMLVPATVAILGHWNWWLPHWPARALRVKPPLTPPQPISEEI